MVNEVMDVWQIYLISKTKKNVVFISIIDYDGLFIYSMVYAWYEYYRKSSIAKENGDIIKCVVKNIYMQPSMFQYQCSSFTKSFT